MNGRSTRQTTKFSSNGGPTVEALFVTTDCREDISLAPDAHCGWQDPVWNKTVYLNETYTSAHLQGNKLVNSARYYSKVYEDLQSNGYKGTFPFPTFDAAGFLRPRGKDCYFT